MDNRSLLVLDLDETLVHTSEAPLEVEAQYEVTPYFLYCRPGLSAFLQQVSELFRLAVWTSSSPAYANAVCPLISRGSGVGGSLFTVRCADGHREVSMITELEHDGFAIVRSVLDKAAVRDLAQAMDERLPQSLSAGVRGLAEKVPNVRDLARSHDDSGARRVCTLGGGAYVSLDSFQ